MKFIPLGLQCSTPAGIRNANMCEYSYPFDWMITPSKTTYIILKILFENGVEDAVNCMITNNKSYKDNLNNKHYELTNYATNLLINKKTGLANIHFKINHKFKTKLKLRFERLLTDVKSNHKILFLF